ncbi:MAG: lipocalin family protein, partial [Sedimenticolaceae bacterium]
SIEGSGTPLFPLRLRAETPEMAIDLQLQAGDRPMVLQGDRGLSQKGAAPGNASYYYSYTRLPTRGEIRLDDRRLAVVGNSWFDREWSSSALAEDQAGWDWFALQLDDDRDLMFYRMRDKQGQAQRFSKGVLVQADGTVVPLSLDDVALTTLGEWRSDDGVAYPTRWRLQIPGQDMDLRVEAAFDDQEMRHTVRYWEGAVVVSGSHSGVGYLELSGYAR